MKITKQYRELLKPLFTEYDEPFSPASTGQIIDFKKICEQKDIPVSVVEQLIEFYSITNGVPCLNGFEFHKIDDEILFEWWNSDKELWLGSKDNDMLRWSENEFCIGDASNVSYSYEYEFDTLIELLQKSFEEWNLYE